MTLVELLIAVTIMTMVIGVATYSFSAFSIYGQADQSKVDRAISRYQRLSLLHSALDGAVPWLVTSKNDEVGFYFLGRDDGFTFVTSQPIFNDGQLAVVRVFREPDVTGAWRLVYEEATISHKDRLTFADQVLPFANRLVVVSGLSKLSFRYFGWSSLRVRLDESSDRKLGTAKSWFTEYDGIARGQNPEKVSVQFDDFFFEVLQPDRSSTFLARVIQE